VSFKYLAPPTSPELRQGELLGDVREFRVEPNLEDPQENSSVNVSPVRHSKLLLITQDCDLLSDFRNRSELQQNPGKTGNLLQHVLFCEAYEETEIRSPQGLNAGIWRQIKENQHERYHCFLEGAIGNDETISIPALYLDFKQTISFPTDGIYQALASRSIRRISRVPVIPLLDFIHRFYAFHGRVAGLEE
jgi:hypothetical protein